MRRPYAHFHAIIAAAALVVLCAAWQPAVAQRPVQHTRQLAHREAKAQRGWVDMSAKAPALTQHNFDVHYYILDLDLDMGFGVLDGKVTMYAEVTSATLDSVELDLYDNMSVTSVKSDSTFVEYIHNNDLLKFALDRTYNLGETIEIEVLYFGTPDVSVGAFTFENYYSNPIAWTLSEPYGARTWWPCKDVPSDKADSVMISVEFPNTNILATNGSFVSESAPAAGRLKQTWIERYPITTYLVSVNVYPFSTYVQYYNYAPTDSMPVTFFATPANLANVQSAWDFTVPMLEAYAPMFGEYPFIEEKYGHVEFPWGGGMEHQTLSSMVWFGGEYLVAHELAHQWYGDAVTCESFHHIWLNEGFATYAEALWSEDQYGEAQYHADMAAAQYFGAGTVFVADTTDINAIFSSSLSYNKGSWVLHMLRHVVGDAAFFNIMQQHIIDHAYSTATTEDFQTVCESESGMDLGFFFQQWIYGEYYPYYNYSWSSTDIGGGQWEVDVTINQIQSWQIFTMPIDVTVTTGGGDEGFVAWDSLASQSFTFTVTGEPTEVVLDKDEWILRIIDEPLSAPTFHRGVLVVNGVHQPTYGSEIESAYADSAFWGCYPITFWDVFPETNPSWYPSNMPAPIGHGAVPADTLQQFSVVVWVGNNYAGDLGPWLDTPILPYLDAGGDVLLMSRYGADFVFGALQDYLGVNWSSTGTTLPLCQAWYPGLSNMALTGTQSLCATIDSAIVNPETEKLFFMDIANLPVVGAWRKPAAGGLHRANRANFAFVSGRPYRYNHAQLRGNVEFILGSLFGEPKVPVTTSTPGLASRLDQNYPNPFNPATTITFALARPGHTTLRIYNAAGQLVRTLIDGPRAGGINHSVRWDGRGENGQRVSSGVYFYRLNTPYFTRARKLVLLK